MPPARICILSSVHFAFDPRIFQKQARSLARAGFAVTLIARADPAGQNTDDIRILSLPAPENRLQRMLGTLRIAVLAHRQRADLYAFHDPELIPVGVLLKLLTRRPVVYDIHEDVPQQILGKEWLPRPGRALVLGLYRLLECLALPFIDGLVLAEHAYLKYYPKRRTLTALNYPLLTYASGDPGQEREEPTRPTLIYVGSIRPLRGLYEMLELVRRLKPSCPDLLLRLVGPLAPAAEEDRARSLIASWGIGANVEWLGRVSHPEVHHQIARSDIGLVLLHPHPNYLDSLPTKMFEYMVMGKPVVVSNFPLWSQIVQEAQCGLAVDPLDPEAVENAVVQLLEDEPRRREMGARGRQAVMTRYNWEVEGEKLVRFYRELMGR